MTVLAIFCRDSLDVVGPGDGVEDGLRAVCGFRRSIDTLVSIPLNFLTTNVFDDLLMTSNGPSMELRKASCFSKRKTNEQMIK